MYKGLIYFLLLSFIHLHTIGQDSTTVISNNEGLVYVNSFEFGNRAEIYQSPYRDRVYTYVQYGRKINNLDVFARLLRYSLGSTVGYMGEVDIYLKFKKNGYGYFNSGYSGSKLLPTFRTRAELYKSIGRFECSLGTGFIKPFNYDGIPIITGTIGYYFGDYFTYLRPTFSFITGGAAKSIFVSGRRYFTKTDYLELSFLKGKDTGAGRNYNAIENSFGLDTYLARVSGRLKRGRYKFGAGLDYGGLFITSANEYAQFFGFDFYINRTF